MNMFHSRAMNRSGLVGMFVLGLLCASAWGADDLVFYSGGRAIPLVKSDTEFHVTMSPRSQSEARAKLAKVPNVVVEPVPWASHVADHCIARMARVGAATRSEVRATPGVIAVNSVFRFSEDGPPMLSTGHAVVRLSPNLTRFQRDQFFNDFRVGIVRTIDADTHVYIVRPIGNFVDGEIYTAAAMYRDTRTLFAHPDFIVQMAPKQIIAQIEDEFFERQWHLRNIGQELGTPGADVNVLGAWETTFGEDVRVGVLDDSVDVQHEDLAANYSGLGHDPFNGEESANAPLPRLPHDAHGTAVIGLTVGAGNERGVRGVAPSARFAASRGLNDLLSLAQVASAYTFARQRDVDVHVNSWGFPFARNSQVDVVVDGIQTSVQTGRNGRGMVIVFAAGNRGMELGTDDDLATLPEVIGVAATNANDLLTSYSDFGRDIDIAAPSGDSFLPGMVTTDTTDLAGFGAIGYNDGSGIDIFGRPDLTNANYTKNFGGTSAACPVAAGVAALVLSVNSELTAEQVRTILSQTAVKVDPIGAVYHPITERSLRYGYGRLDATAAVAAATQSLDNGNLSWPEPLATIEIRGNVLTWTVGDKVRQIDHDNNPATPAIQRGDSTFRTLVVESTSPFNAARTFIPQDGTNYAINDEPVSGIFVRQNDASLNFQMPRDSATRFFALFPTNSVGRFGYGVSIDTNGNVDGVAGGGSSGDGGTTTSFDRPVASIEVSPLSGTSPLEVRFRGNVISNRPLNMTEWDFDDGGAAERSHVTHVYEVGATETRRFFPSFLVEDDQGVVTTRTVAIDVSGRSATSATTSDAEIRILISLPGSIGSNVDLGTAPFAVQLNISGTPANEEIVSVFWDLGDGSTADTISVPHIYENDSGVRITLPISVELVTRDPNGILVTQAATRFVTVEPNPIVIPSEPDDSVGESTFEDSADRGTTGDGTAVQGGTGDDSNSADSDADGSRSFPLVDLCGTGTPVAMVGMLCFAFIRRRLG